MNTTGMYLEETRTIGDSSANCAPNINVCTSGQSDVGSGAKNDAMDAVETAFGQAYSAGYIAGARIRAYSTWWDPDCCDDFLVDWVNHLEANNVSETGSWLGIHSCNDQLCGNNQNAAYPGGGWVTRKEAVATTDNYGFGTDYYKNIVVQEVCHNLIHYFEPNDSENCDYVASKVDGSQHDLGEDIYYSGDYFNSPMVTGHNDRAKYGTCNQDNTTVDEILELTPCTMDSLQYSANHELNGHFEDAC